MAAWLAAAEPQARWTVVGGDGEATGAQAADPPAWPRARARSAQQEGVRMHKSRCL